MVILVNLSCHSKIPQPGWLKQQKLFFTVLEAQKSKIKELVEVYLCGMVTATTASTHMAGRENSGGLFLL